MLRRKIKNFILLFVVVAFSTASQAQETSIDWELHDVGDVLQLVTNTGAFWRSYSNYPGLIYTEYPRGSLEEHLGEAGIWVGAIHGGDTSVSVTTGWNSSVEFFPTAEPWDTCWVVERNDTVDIPYWQNYVGVSDQDIICRYNDYTVRNISNHDPLYIDVIQTSYSWSSEPVSNTIVITYYVIPQRFDLEDTYVAFWCDANVGYRSEGWSFALDDYSEYVPELHLGVGRDDPSGIDGLAHSPIGTMLFPPENIPEDSIDWTFFWWEGGAGNTPDPYDPNRYKQMSKRSIMVNQLEPRGSQYMVTFGPVDLKVGDTLKFRAAFVLGNGYEGMIENAEKLQVLANQEFKVPSPPPAPVVDVTTEDGTVKLNWRPQPGEKNPEEYVDPYRGDTVTKPFEGYRLYKSTKSSTGPWTLLGEYDIPNDLGYNTGLQYEYTDRGLLNNIEYYYSITAFSRPDDILEFPELESSVFNGTLTAIPGTGTPESVGQVSVVPNPYRGDISYHQYDPPWEKPPESRGIWMEQDRRIQFINLPERCRIKIYTVSGDLLAEIDHNDPNRGYEDWNLTSDVGQAIASGIYLFTCEDLDNGEVQVGKFVVIK